MSASVLLPGFADPVHDAQRVFRAAMDALARPGSQQRLSARLQAPRPLLPAAAALSLTLVDHETPLWLDAPLAASAEVASYLRFHCGARIVTDPAAAAFALISAPLQLPALTSFAQGTLEYPDRSATLIIQVEHLDTTAGWTLTGPGIASSAKLSAGPLPSDFLQRMAANRALFPRGLDLMLVAADAIVALPRTTGLAA
jgi:alpha-D-ribose 1-methylphosphonate 5-triphosphate synthase subunit PhnH